MKVIGVIPARLASTRLPGKALLPIAGKPMIQHVYERVIQARLDEVLVATDAEEIAVAVRAFGARVEMTSPAHQSGTDRLVELAGSHRADLYINIQGDEPLISPEVIDRLAQAWREDRSRDVWTAANPHCSDAEFRSPHAVKVVCDQAGDALYFSRAPIPFVRSEEGGEIARKHIGLYGYTAAALQLFGRVGPGVLERTEQLEQLRFLENGMKIRVIDVDYHSIGVDTMEDLQNVRAELER